MITKEKLEELRQRMLHHQVENDVAVVKLSAKELCDLLETVDAYHKVSGSFVDLLIDRIANTTFWWNR